MFTTKNLLLLILRHLLIALLVICACSIAILFLSRTIEKISSSVVQNRKLASALAERTALLSQLKHDAEIVGSNTDTITHAFPPSDNVIEFISALESIALKNGVSQTFRFSSPIPANLASPVPLSTVNYQNTLTVNFPTFIQYIKDLENLPFFTTVDGITITSQSPQGLQGVTTAAINATLYTRSTQ
jgi:Tfp pilus assembly protein PilO